MIDNYEIKINERLQQLEIAKRKEWYDDTLKYYTKFTHLEYWNSLPTKELGYVDIPLNRVIGTNHKNYKNKSWIENLGRLKRFYSSYSKSSCLDYFASQEKKDISYRKLGDDYFIMSGNHRTHIARFLGLTKIQGSVTEHFFDQELFDLINRYDEHHLELECMNAKVYRDARWKVSIDTASVYIHGYDLLKEFVDYYERCKVSKLDALLIEVTNSLSLSEQVTYVHLGKKEDFEKVFFTDFRLFKYNHLQSEVD